VTYISNLTRPEGDPKVLSTGPSSMDMVDQLGRGLGWFSIGLGLLELLSPRSITAVLGMRGREGLVRAYGAREISSGLLSLSIDKDLGLWSRVLGDGLDIATVLAASRPNNRQRKNLGVALMVLLGVTALDVMVAQQSSARHARRAENSRNYRDRSGFPQGLAKARGAGSAQLTSNRRHAPRSAKKEV